MSARNLLPEDQRTFDRWINANAIFGAILFIGMLAMALAGAHSPRHVDTAVAAIPVASK